MNILLTSCGRRSYMVRYFKEALKGIGQIHAANSVETYALQIADKSIVTPLIFDDIYIDFLLSYCKRNHINAIIPLFDIDLPVLSKNHDKFAQNGVIIVVSNKDIVQICNDKWLTWKFLKENKFLTPHTYIQIEDCKKDISNGSIKFPLIIKPRWGMGSIGIFEADDFNELETLYRKTERIILESYLKYESNITPEKCVIIQEKIIGDEYGLDIFNDLKGCFLTCIPKRKLAMRAGETDSAEIVKNKSLFDLGVKLSDRINHIANLDVDCFKKGDIYYILEMNCRFGGQYPFAHLAGANFPKAIVQMLLGETLDKNQLKAIFGTVGIKDLVPVKL